MEPPDKRVRLDAIISGLRHNNQRATALRVAQSKLAEDHRSITMCHKVSRGNAERVKHLTQFFSTLGQAHKVRARLVPTIKNHTPRCAESPNLTRIDKLQMFKNRHEDQWLTYTKIDEGQINSGDGHT